MQVESKDEKHNFNKKLNIVLAFYLSIILLCLMFFITYVNQIKVVKFNDKFYIDVNVDEEKIWRNTINKKINMIENGEDNFVDIFDLGIGLKIDRNKSINFKIAPFVNVDSANIYFFDKTLTNEISEINNGRVQSRKPELKIIENKIIVDEGIPGNYINVELVTNDILNALSNNIYEINLNSYYCNDKEIETYKEKLLEEKRKIEDFKISYTNGYEINGLDLLQYFKLENDKIVFKEELEKECFKYIDKLLERNLGQYDTVGSSWNFTTHYGATINVSGGTYGDYYSSDKETEYIMSKLKLFQSELNRMPIKTQDFPDEIPNTYIEVSLKEQHMWYYKDGNLILDSDIVTGRYKKNDTPKGVYYISEMKNGKYLTGADYKTWVNKWMRITNRGHGLHDATWRSEFGSDIYMTNGSHGCINLPKSIAYNLYDKIKLNDCVVIY